MDRACQGFVCRRAYFYSIDLNLVGSTASTYDTNQHDCYNGEDFPMARMALFLRAAIFVLFVPLACLADPTTWPPATDWIEIRRNGNRRFRGNNGMWTDSAQADRQTDRDWTRAKSSASMALWQIPDSEWSFAITLLAQSGNSMFQSNNSSINRSRVFRIETQRKQAGLAGNFAAGQVGNKEGRHRRSLAYLSVEADKSRMAASRVPTLSASLSLSFSFAPESRTESATRL